MYMFIILIVMMALWVYTYVKIHQIVQFKYVQCIGYQLYLNKTVKNNKYVYIYTHTYTLTIWPSILFLDIYPRDMNTYIYILELEKPIYNDKRQIILIALDQDGGVTAKWHHQERKLYNYMKFLDGNVSIHPK